MNYRVVYESPIGDFRVVEEFYTGLFYPQRNRWITRESQWEYLDSRGKTIIESSLFWAKHFESCVR